MADIRQLMAVLEAHPPRSDVATRAAVVVCPQCGEECHVPATFQDWTYLVPHTPRLRVGDPYNDYTTYHRLVCRAYRYGIPGGEKVRIWLPDAG